MTHDMNMTEGCFLQLHLLFVPPENEISKQRHHTSEGMLPFLRHSGLEKH